MPAQYAWSTKRVAAASVALVMLLVLVVGSVVPTYAGLGKKKVRYLGGTLSSVPENAEGNMFTTDATVLVFEWKAKGKRNRLEIPYNQINSLEYGQKAGRRLGLAIAVTPLALLSKKRRHFLTIGFVDENGQQQAGVFELGKEIRRVILPTLEARTGKQIEYQDEEARKAVNK
jgi:hypothetical protein